MLSPNFACVPTKISCLMLVILLTACGKHDGNKASTQVAAQVDGTEISLLQVNQVLRNAGNIAPENASKVRNQILDKLIDQQVIVKKAMNDNLDRSPEVMVAIEAAKKDILAKAYLQKLVSSTVKISNQQVKDYYSAHEGLFSKRRIYTLQDVSTLKNDQALTAVNEALAKQRDMQEVTDALNAQSIKYTKDIYTRAAEQIPLDVLDKIQSLKDGEILAIDIADTLHILLVVKTEDSPVTLTEATPVIKNYLFNVQGKQLVEDKMKQLRAQANVVLKGDFTKVPHVETASKTEPALAPKEINKASVISQPTKDKSSIEKGLTGL